MLEDIYDPESGRLQAPVLQTLNVNLLGVIYTTKLAVHYFAKQPTKKFQLVLTGSAACFLDTPPLWTYCAAKSGVMGLMRSLRTQLPKNDSVTINMVAPWMTSETPWILKRTQPQLLTVSARDTHADGPISECMG